MCSWPTLDTLSPHFSPHSLEHMCNRHDITDMMVITLRVKAFLTHNQRHVTTHLSPHPFSSQHASTPTGRATKKASSSSVVPRVLTKNRLGVENILHHCRTVCVWLNGETMEAIWLHGGVYVHFVKEKNYDDVHPHPHPHKLDHLYVDAMTQCVNASPASS